MSMAILGERDVLARYETIDCGKPIIESEEDIDAVAECFNFYADLAHKLETDGPRDLNIKNENMEIVVVKEPLGVCALITPWNWKVAASLAAGNTVVLKPSELSSVTCLELASLANDAGLPAGVLNIITGFGHDAGAALSSSPRVHKVSFTGSVPTGQRIGLSAIKNLKPTTLELGGKSPIIIFEDAIKNDKELDKVVEWILFGIFWTCGEICSATSRLLVEDRAAERLYAALKRRAEEIKVGNPLDRNTKLGAIVSESQYKKVLSYIEIAKSENCRLLTGGGPHQGLARGFYVSPTIFADVDTEATIWKEEIFGPVLACRRFSTEVEALTLANDSEFALGAAIFSKDLARCERFVNKFEAGIVWVNNNQLSHISAPWGGKKNSGFGRDCGDYSLEHYVHLKQVIRWKTEAPLEWFYSKIYRQFLRSPAGRLFIFDENIRPCLIEPCTDNPSDTGLQVLYRRTNKKSTMPRQTSSG